MGHIFFTAALLSVSPASAQADWGQVLHAIRSRTVSGQATLIRADGSVTRECRALREKVNVLRELHLRMDCLQNFLTDTTMAGAVAQGLANARHEWFSAVGAIDPDRRMFVRAAVPALMGAMGTGALVSAGTYPVDGTRRNVRGALAGGVGLGAATVVGATGAVAWSFARAVQRVDALIETALDVAACAHSGPLAATARAQVMQEAGRDFPALFPESPTTRVRRLRALSQYSGSLAHRFERYDHEAGRGLLMQTGRAHVPNALPERQIAQGCHQLLHPISASVAVRTRPFRVPVMPVLAVGTDIRGSVEAVPRSTPASIADAVVAGIAAGVLGPVVGRSVPVAARAAGLVTP